MNTIFSINWILLASAWYFINGILHDIFVLIRHKGSYNRELLRLLMDGHVLMLSGIILFICHRMIVNKIVYGVPVAAVTAVFMLIYCFMIFPFLKSFGTMTVSIMLMAVCVRLYFSFFN